MPRNMSRPPELLPVVRRHRTVSPWALPVITIATLVVTPCTYFFFPDLSLVVTHDLGLPLWSLGVLFLFFLPGVLIPRAFPALKKYWLVPAVLYRVAILAVVFEASRQCPPPLRTFANCPVIAEEKDSGIGDNR